MKSILFIAFAVVCNACVSSGNTASFNGRDSNYACFIAYETRDTLKGNTLTKKNGTTVLLDGKPVSLITKDRIVSFQDKKGLYYPYYTLNYKLAKYEMDFSHGTERFIKGRICLYHSIRISGYRAPNDVRSNMQSQVYLSKDSGFDQAQTATSALLEEMVRDYPPALKKFREEFPRPNGATSNDYPKMMRIITVYNNR
jgi:hypothetical protein